METWMEKLGEKFRGKPGKKKIYRAGMLFMMALFMGILFHTEQALADPVPEGTYTPGEGTPEEMSLTYTFTGDNTQECGYVANVESYRSSAINNGVLTIPATIKYGERDVKVAGILRRAFNGCTSLTTLVLPDTLSYIGQEAFNNCVNLASIQTKAESTTLNGHLAVENIEYRAFYGCSSLTGIQLGEKIQGNNRMGVQTVQNEAFMNCTNLNSLEIGPTVTWIEGGAFANCTSLDGLAGGVKIRDNPLYFVHNGILYYREGSRSNVLLLCPAGTQSGILTNFPENVTQIRNQAFYGCRGLSSITIPNTVKSIGDRAFYDCIGLGNVTIPDSVTSIGAEVFKNCSSGLCIICTSGSTADRYAITNNLTRSVECTITFYNTETRQSIEKKVMSGGTVDPPLGWERTGYVLRWTDDFNSNTIVNANRTVSTVWKKLYTVTFRDDSTGNESVVSGVEEGTEAAAPNWSKKGYVLTWSTENYKRVNADLTVNAIWMVSLVDDPNQDTLHKKGDLVTIGNIVYKISSINDKRVRVMSLVDETVAKVVIPNSITFDGQTYAVTCINANAFRGNRYMTKVTLGTNIRSIEHYAFYNCTKLSKVVINSRNLVNVSNYAFKKTKTTLKVYVPTRSLIASYRSTLLDGGMNRKAKVVKKP